MGNSAGNLNQRIIGHSQRKNKHLPGLNGVLRGRRIYRLKYAYCNAEKRRHPPRRPQ
jgi:hypothetical protein